jgi:hypothetical protein
MQSREGFQSKVLLIQGIDYPELPFGQHQFRRTPKITTKYPEWKPI